MFLFSTFYLMKKNYFLLFFGFNKPTNESNTRNLLPLTSRYAYWLIRIGIFFRFSRTNQWMYPKQTKKEKKRESFSNWDDEFVWLPSDEINCLNEQTSMIHFDSSSLTPFFFIHFWLTQFIHQDETKQEKKVKKKSMPVVIIIVVRSVVLFVDSNWLL